MSSDSRPVALVTGGASGIGRVAVRRLVNRGFDVAVLDVGEDGLAAVVAEFGSRVRTYTTNVADAEAVEAAVAGVEDAMGPIEHTFVCAGVARVGPTLHVAPGDVRLMTRVNYGGVVNVVCSVLPRMMGRRRGEFAVVASLTGLVPPRKMAAYGASKAAVVGFLQALRYDLDGTGIRLACVCPATVATPMAEVFFADPGKRARAMAMAPEAVVIATEKALRRGRFLVLPGATAKTMYALQRIAPALIRRIIGSRHFDLV